MRTRSLINLTLADGNGPYYQDLPDDEVAVYANEVEIDTKQVQYDLQDGSRTAVQAALSAALLSRSQED